MFYSHEVLTSRRYGVATVWLVATVGTSARASLKRVSRKAILDVDVAKACETIVTPGAPMALRLQSSLLFGVARVYSKQCGYVLADTEHAFKSMQTLLKNLRTADLEQEGGNRGRYEHLVLQDDPHFIAEFGHMPADIDLLAISDTTLLDDTQSQISPMHSQHTPLDQISLGELVLPGSNSPGGGEFGDFNMFGMQSDSVAGSKTSAPRELEPDTGFIIGPDGTIYMDEEEAYSTTRSQGRASIAKDPAPIAPNHRANDCSLAAGHQASEQGHTQDFAQYSEDVVVMEDNDDAYPSDHTHIPRHSSEDSGYHDDDSNTAQAPQRHTRQRLIPLDVTISLRNRELAAWNSDYVANQLELARHKQAVRLRNLAKENARSWILDHPGYLQPHPALLIFTGAQLLEAFTGVPLTSPSHKRPREDDHPAQPERNVRARVDGDDHPMAFDDPTLDLDQPSPNVELGRRAPTPLEEPPSSIFPWNQSGSRIASDSHVGRRGSRMVSASPLLGREPAFQLGSESGVGGGADYGDDYAGGFSDDLNLPAAHDADHNEGSAAKKTGILGMQMAGESQSQHTSLGDTTNFLDFVKAAIKKKGVPTAMAEDGEENEGQEVVGNTIEFENLFPPEDNSVVVAAQAFLHVLTLTTRNVLRARQEEHLGPIELRLVEVV